MASSFMFCFGKSLQLYKTSAINWRFSCDMQRHVSLSLCVGIKTQKGLRVQSNEYDITTEDSARNFICSLDFSYCQTTDIFASSFS